MRGLAGLVLLTGGTGSIGHALLARAIREDWDASFIVYSRDEMKQAAMRAEFASARYALGDVADAESLGAAMRDVDVVVHAAAYKLVPEAERETLACVRSNVTGSANVVRLAQGLGIPRVVGLSTDKACAPINAYGQSKALMERLFQSGRGTRFTIARYGNVIASRGSVVPSLRTQAAHGGPLELTDPQMTRFWVTLDDAVDLIVEAARLPHGSILIPRARSSTMATMGEAVAPGMAQAAVGVRAGEKRHEQLLNAHESPHATSHPLGFTLHPLSGPAQAEFPPGFEYRSDTAWAFSPAELREVIGRMDRGEIVRTVAA